MEHPSNIQNRKITRPNKPITLFFVYFRNIAKKKRSNHFIVGKIKTFQTPFPLNLYNFYNFSDVSLRLINTCIISALNV